MSDLTAAPNGVYKLKCVAVDGDGAEIEPRLSDWVLAGNTDTRTSVDNEGVLKIGPAEAGTLTVTVEGAGESGSFEVAVSPQGAPYWPVQGGAGPNPPEPTPATVEFTVKSVDDDTDAVSPLAKASRWSVVLQSDQALPADAQVTLTTDNPTGVLMVRAAHGTHFVVYMLSIAPNAEDGASISLEAGGTGITTQTMEYTVATA